MRGWGGVLNLPTVVVDGGVCHTPPRRHMEYSCGPLRAAIAAPQGAVWSQTGASRIFLDILDGTLCLSPFSNLRVFGFVSFVCVRVYAACECVISVGVLLLLPN